MESCPSPIICRYAAFLLHLNPFHRYGTSRASHERTRTPGQGRRVGLWRHGWSPATGWVTTSVNSLGCAGEVRRRNSRLSAATSRTRLVGSSRLRVASQGRRLSVGEASAARVLGHRCRAGACCTPQLSRADRSFWPRRPPRRLRYSAEIRGRFKSSSRSGPTGPTALRSARPATPTPNLPSPGRPTASCRPRAAEAPGRRHLPRVDLREL